MADKKISQLPAATTPLTGTEVLPIVQSGVTDKVSVANLTAGRAVSALSLTSTNDASINGLTVGKGAGTITQNSAVGVSALAANTTGAYNTAIGYEAGYSITDKTQSTYVGYRAGRNSTGELNTFIGSQAGYATTGTQNAFFGQASGYGVTSGSKNVILGQYSGAASPISATGSNYVVLSDGEGNIKAYGDPSHNFVVPNNLVIGTSGKGIDFSATASGSGTMTSELLADYEEGTWSPTLTTTNADATISSYSTRTGWYVKVGSVVTVTCYTRATVSNVGTGSVLVSGLPFSNSGYYDGIAPGLINMLNGGTPATANVYVDGTTAVFGGCSYSTSAGAYLTFTVSYKV